jgi:hypothetical protein
MSADAGRLLGVERAFECPYSESGRTSQLAGRIDIKVPLEEIGPIQRQLCDAAL